MKIINHHTEKQVTRFILILLFALLPFILMISCSLEPDYEYGYKYLAISSAGELSTVDAYQSHAIKDYVVKSDLVIPTTLNGIRVTSIGDYAFEDCSSLTSITIPDSVISIGVYAFYGCTSLTNIRIDESNPNYSSNGPILYNKNRTSLLAYPSAKGIIIIPSTVTYIGPGAFRGADQMTAITIPDSVTSIGNGAFRDCSSLTSITIPDSVISIGMYAFDNCGALNVIFKDGIAHIPNILQGSSIVSVSIPSSVTSIGEYAFSGCSKLASITIPDSVTTIGHYAFSGCSKLASITIPSSVTSIGWYAFGDCSSLTNIVYTGTTAQWEQIHKYSSWASGCATNVVVCSDGNVSI